MLAYAPRPRRKLSPPALAFVIGLHLAGVGALLVYQPNLVFSDKGDRPTIVRHIPLPEPPPPTPVEPTAPTQHAASQKITEVKPLVPLPLPGPAIETDAIFDTAVTETAEAEIADQGPPLPLIAPVVYEAARLLTPADRLKPPYPASKIRSDEEALLRLKLSIDTKGRVIAVEPVADADPAFFRAAERHIKRHWRYAPATEDGQPVAATTTISLKFELEG